MVEHEVDDDLKAKLVSPFDKTREISVIAKIGVDFVISSDIITVVQPRRLENRPQPNDISTEVGDYVKMLSSFRDGRGMLVKPGRSLSFLKKSE